VPTTAAARALRSLRITIVSLDDPWERPHGGTLRTRSIVAASHALGHEVHVVFPGVQPTAEHRLDGVTYHPVASRPIGERNVPPIVSKAKKTLLPLPTLRGGFVGALAEAVRAIGDSDVLGVSQLRATQYVDHAGPGARLWLDQSDLWSGMLGPEIAKRRGVARLAATGQRAHIHRAETTWLQRADVVTAAGFGDTEVINNRVGAKARWLPTPVSPPATAVPPPSAPAVGLLGNFAFWPNRDAYDLLREEWAPALKAQGVDVIVAGFGSAELPAADGVALHGPVGSLSEFYSLVSATVAPIRLGGGIKVKIAESLVFDRPVLATAKALEGFDPAIRARIPSVDRSQLRDVTKLLAPDPDLFDRARDVFSMASFTATVREALEAIDR
jgi:polysaccharide biosynthesis protein PslH